MSQNDQEESKHASVAPSESSNFLQGWLSDQFSRKEDKDMSDAPAEQAPRVDDSLGDSTNIHVALKDDGLGHNPPRVIVRKQEEDEVSALNSGRREAGHGRSIISYAASLSSADETNSCSDQENSQRPSKKKRGVRGMRLSASKERSSAYSVNSFDVNKLSDEENDGLHNCTDQDVHKLKETLHGLNFEDIDKILPWTPEMELDDKAVGDNKADEMKSEEPLNDAEIACLRQKMRTSRMFGQENNEETTPLTFDDEGRPMAVSDFDRGPRGKALRKIKENLDRPATKLSEDSFSFLISARPLSVPFILGGLVLLVKGTLFTLICINLTDMNDEDNPLGIPAGVSPTVAVAQFLAMFIAVLTQDDIRTALNYFQEGYEAKQMGAAFIGAGYWQWLISVWLQFLEGSLGLGATFLLIVTSDEVVALILDFTAVEFITLLDNAAFLLAGQGFMGPKNKLEFEIVMNTEYVIPKSRKRTPKRQICTLFATFSVLLIGWSVIYARQMQGYYTPQSITIQFDDDLRPELGAYSGLYDLTIQPNKIDISRVAYKAVNGEGFIGYCYPRKYWTFSTGNTDPCSNIVVKSSPSHSFDITDATDDEWFATEDSDLQRYYPMENFLLELTCDRDVDCGGIGHGSCEDHQCACSEGYYGIRCDYHVDDACESIAVDERRDLFRASRNYASSFDLLRDANGQIVQVYHHPVFVSDSETDGGLDVIMYIGARWALSHSIEGLPQLGDHSYEGLAEYLSTAAFHAAEHLKSLAFFTEPVIFNSPDDGDSPVGIRWFNVLEADLSNTARLGSINTLMLCAVCNTEENPCQNGNQCGEEGACKCANGASGGLCQITPLGNGHCDIFFNSASYKYDGGDCCKATCISSQDHTCGAISTTTQSAVDQGFPYCVDPTVVAPCGSESCWAPTSRHVDLRHSVTTLTTLSANGRILAVVAPSLDIVTVYDQQDSRWIQRGPILEGKRGSQFGKTLALSTLPGAIVNRRYGKVPILMAIGIHGLSKAGVRITRWEPNDLDWRPVGDVIDICSSSPVNCDLLAVDIGRDGDRVMLAVVRKDNVVQVYRTTLTETGSQPWVLDYLADGNEEQESKGFYKCASLSGMTNLVALARGNLVELYYPEDNADPGSSLFDVPSYVLDIRVQVNLIQNYFGYDNFTSPVESIHSVKLSADEKSLLVFCEGEGEYDYLIRYVVTPSQPPIANNFRNFTTSILSEKAIKSGLSIVRFSSDASSIAVRVNTTDGPRVRLVSYNATSQEFDPVGALFTDIQEEMRLNEALGNDFIDELQDFGLSYDGGSYIQGGTNGPEGYGIVPRCTTASDHYRIAITLDENPSSVSWTLDTYQILGNRTFPNRVVRECDSCYFDDDRFGRGIVADDVCVQTNFGACLRLQFQSKTGLQPGSGMVLFKDGQEEARFEERDTDPFYHLPNPEAVSDCTVPILNCAEDQVHIVVEMNLDDFSSLDTSWMLLDDNSTILAEGGGYTNEEDRSTILSQVCADKNSTFEFTILDGPPEDAFFDPENFDTNKYRIDGLCCDWGKGGYSIYVDGEKTHSLQGERDFRMEELLFDSDGSVLARTVPITFEIQLDAFPDEITWWFESPDQTEIWWFRDYLRTQVAPNSYITDTLYLVEGASYYLVLRDAFADGFCCGEYGDGYYNVYWGTEVDPSKKMLSATGDFAPDNFVDHLIVVSEDSILEPTQPPVATPDPTIEPTEGTDYEGPSGGNHTTGGEGSGTNSTTEGDNERS